MDKSHRLYSIKNQAERISFDEISFRTNRNDALTEDFARHFSIDDDDIVRLDQSQIAPHEVNNAINSLVDNVLHQENSPSQIRTIQNKRSYQSHNDEHRLTKKIRLDIPTEEQQSLNSLFISENLHPTKQLNPYTQFLYNLGFDICLQQNPDENNILTEYQKQLLIKQNEVFYKPKIYSCKYCSFKTDTIHVIDRHYRTPHTSSNSIHHSVKYFCTYCSYKTFRIPELRRHCDRKHHFSLITEPSVRRYSCSYCYYESDDKLNFTKHISRCQIEQERTRIANNLLAPFDPLTNNNSKPL